MFLHDLDHHEGALGTLERLEAERLRIEPHRSAAVRTAFFHAHGPGLGAYRYPEQKKNIGEEKSISGLYAV
jgi:hypothetical protein